MEVASKPKPPENFMHKNRLQEYAQRSALPLPVYQTFIEGSSHAPQFRPNVIVDGVTFSLSQSFSNRKEAEQMVAKLALEGISNKIKQEGRPLVHADTTFCKSILHEYAAKMKLENPTYTCSMSQGLLPVFTSSVSFAGKVYEGVVGRNKKEAQQLAARAVIESILGDSNSATWTPMSQIIKSKGKFYAAINHISDSNVSPAMHPASEGNTENCLECSLVKCKELQLGLTNEETPAAELALTLPSREISEECPTHVAQIQPEENCVLEVNSGSIGCETTLIHQPQGGPQAVQASLSSEILVDDSHLILTSPVKTESCEPTYRAHEEHLTLPMSPLDAPSGISNGTERMSSSSIKRHSKKGKGGCRGSKSKRSRTGKGSVKIESCEPTCSPRWEPSALPTSPLFDPSGLSDGTERKRMKKRSKKGKGGRKASNYKKS